MLACLPAGGVEPSDEVIVAAATMAAIAIVVLQARGGAGVHRPGFETFTIGAADVRPKVTGFTRAAIPIAVFGLPADFDAIGAIRP